MRFRPYPNLIVRMLIYNQFISIGPDRGISCLLPNGTLSADELLGVLPLVKGEDVRLGVEDPKPIGAGGPEALPMGPAIPDFMLEERLTPEPIPEQSSEFKDTLEPEIGFSLRLFHMHKNS